jgi:hypothetical protein
MSKYVIIDVETIQKRIEELEKEMFFLNWNAKDAYEDIGKLSAYKKILSQSTPLIPEIEKAFYAGVKSRFDNIGKPTIDSVIQDEKDYISNLKLDI